MSIFIIMYVFVTLSAILKYFEETVLKVFVKTPNDPYKNSRVNVFDKLSRILFRVTFDYLYANFNTVYDLLV